MKIISFLIGLLLIGVIIFSGYYTMTHTNFVIWFGVITAIISPFAFEFIISPFKSKEKEVIKKLSKVPQIEQLIKNAEDNESKIALLESQRKELDKLIAYESQKKTLEAERAIYILQGEESLEKIKEINTNLELLTKTKQELPENLKSLMTEIERIDLTDITYLIGDKKFTIKQKYFNWFPFYGNAVFEVIKASKEMMNKLDKPK
jgi:seryl-tRNA synthetase